MMSIKVIGAFLAIFSFGIILEIPKKYLSYAGVVGAIGWFSYLISIEGGANDILATFLSAVVIAFVSHIFARVFKTPVTVFLVAGILPTVPGAGMYRIVYYFIQNDTAMTSHYFMVTLMSAGAIAIALFLVDAAFRVFQRGWKQNSLKYQQKNVAK